jgi:hypothetical protein
VPLEKNPASLRCRGPIQSFPNFQDYGDRPQITLVPLSGGFARLSPDLATPFGTELIFRDAAGTLWLERPAGNHPLNSARCSGRIHHADAIRRMIIVGCVRKRGKRDLYLSGPGFIKNLNISVAEAELDEWANASPRLVPLYPGADAAVLDMDQRELLFLHRGDVVLATKNGSALIRRGNTLVVYDATTRGEDIVPVVLEKTPDILVTGSVVFVSPVIFDLETRKVLGISSKRPLALASNGKALISETPPSATTLAKGPLHWVAPATRPAPEAK